MTEDDQTRRASLFAIGRHIAENRVSLNEMVERLATLDLDERQRRLMEDGITAGRLLQANVEATWRVAVADGEVPRELWGETPTLSPAEEAIVRASLLAESQAGLSP